MQHPELPSPDSDGSGSSDEFPQYPVRTTSSFGEAVDEQIQTPASTITSSPPPISPNLTSWSNTLATRPRGASLSATTLLDKSEGLVMASDLRPQRPSGPARTPSNTYAPQRRPPQYISLQEDRQRSSSAKRGNRRDPNAQYRAQEKAYVQRIRANPQAWYHHSKDAQSNSMIEGDGDLEEPSPSSEVAFEDDSYDPDTQLFLPDDNLPSTEELKHPKNQERLEWHSMLASVLKGDVVKQEKQRLIGSAESKRSAAQSYALWIGVRARTCGRSIPLQRKLIEDARSRLGPLIEDIIGFQIKGETEIGKPARRQVEDVVEKIERCEILYSSHKEMELANPRVASEEFTSSRAAIFAWHNITALINTELAVLQSWVGNEALDFSQPRIKSAKDDLSDGSSFLDRIMKEDGLKTLQDKDGMLLRILVVIQKAKSTLIENSEAFAARHLPPYIEELLTLINFPSRLIQEIIRVRLSYAKNMKDPAQQAPILIDQMISQFQILMKVAVDIKFRYLDVSRPEPGWDLPPCVDENFDNSVLDAMKYYFRLLNWKLNANKNTFKEAEILEQEWGFSYDIGCRLDGGDIEVAEQFSALTARSLQRLMIHFERELVPRPTETVQDMDKRYKSILDSTRIRQRKLYRFSKFLCQLFENATEYNITTDIAYDFFEALLISDHFLVTSTTSVGQKGVYLVAHHALWNRPADIQGILSTSFKEDDTTQDVHVPYVLAIRPEKPLAWAGKEMQVDFLEHPTDVRLGKLRIVVGGMQERLQNARLELARLTGIQLDMVIEQRANLGRVNVELNKIKKISFKLSMTIMDSVAIIKDQLHERNWENNDLIQACYAFATEFGKRSSNYVDANRRAMNSARLVELSLDWVAFICDECDAADRKTFKWAVAALEFAMAITSSRHLLSMDQEQFSDFRLKVAGCMSLLISHFDIMGARSSLAAKNEKRMEERNGARQIGAGRITSDEEASKLVRDTWYARIVEIEDRRIEEDAKRQALGKVLEGSDEADRSLTVLSSSATNVTLRWQQGQFIGGGTFGSVYVAINLDSNYLMAVKEIRLQDPQLIPKIAQQIRDEMGVLEVLDHPNIVSYHGIEVHRDKVYIFMEYCSGGSLASLLEHGRIEDETVIMVYALQLLEGLAYLHEAHIVHRDIKPENILLDHNGVIKYVDFGAAKIIAGTGRTVAPMDNPQGAGFKEPAKDPTNQRKNQKTTTGTPMYMSPEVIRGDAANLDNRQGAVDIWSLGCVVLEMATGRRPWSTLDNEWAIMYNIAQGKTPALPSRDQLSDLGIDFVRRCFECDPARRATAAELLQHEWIVSIRQQIVLEPPTPSNSDYSSSSNSSSRQNSSYI
ncbi:Mitogen-activated protein (MAP) kinase kinase kinase SSK22 [Penicillium cf. griseofulvum]|uniref:MAP kinase kinase kinase n=1 Tax=Penicillium cf. griseofulvum TaxID=2972120 RepID=A0A9W9N166_9EURO|nr:Mitogen-activated protein (MAP) kinase kinase kinase SSK22 [Penicillium cf. griseofulvum]KAJ5422530.1 Mitogen-activated protein (MAP) kinase kinase kinase SSK22 [Penicillium cf. griseofulvum]KAJ5428707.1 Mitogen-activated protein (MAP) kinase kinase kinase SSK22 [Penicillium cf. griseofulvum]